MARKKKKKSKAPAISCHLPRKNQMQGNKRVMGNFNLNKWVYLCCALVLNLCSDLTHSWVPQYISRHNSFCIPWSKSALFPWGFRISLLSCYGASMSHGLIWFSQVGDFIWKPWVVEKQNLSPYAKIRKVNSTGVSSWENSVGWLLLDLSLAAGTDYSRLMRACFSETLNVLNFQIHFKRSICSCWPKGSWDGSSVL